MPEMEKKILSNFEKAIPCLTEMEREKLLSFGEGLAYATASRKQQGQQDTEEPEGQQSPAEL